MFKIFTRYLSVGVFNTLIHWLIFSFLVYALTFSQSLSNLLAFAVAVTFSFVANAKWTFKKEATKGRYALFVLFMGALAWLIGHVADVLHYSAIITMILFSGISLVIGFIYSKLVVFREAV